MFRVDRPQIRDVDVEVVTPGAETEIAPAGGASEAEPVSDALNGTERRSFLPRRWQRGLAPSVVPAPEIEGTHGLNGTSEAVTDAAPVEARAAAEPRGPEPESPPNEQPLHVVLPADTPPETDVEAPEPAETSRGETGDVDKHAVMESQPTEQPVQELRPEAEEPEATTAPVERRAATAAPQPNPDSPPAEEPIKDDPAGDKTSEARPSSTRSLKTRVVLSSTPATGFQRGHTLKVTKPAPSPSTRDAPPLPREPVPKPKPLPASPQSAAPPPIPPSAEIVSEAPLEASPAPAAPTPPTEQTCEVLFWRGYRKAAFYGRTFDETGEPVAVAESPFFRPQGNGAPEPTEAAKAAYDALRSQLVEAGWEPMTAGDAWFEETFRLTVARELEPE